MCVICASAKGIRQPTVEELASMFNSNPDGAGYMTTRNGAVEMHKGFMSWTEFYRAVKAEGFTEDDVVIYHFRISTQAGVKPSMTHPFPLSKKLKDMKELDLTCSCGVAHNGVIRMTTNHADKEYSDTARFITRYLVKLVRSRADLHDGNVHRMIYELTQSKWALLDKSGELATVGNFINEDGLLFSNYSYKGNYSRGCRNRHIPFEIT